MAANEILPASFTTPDGIQLAADIAGEPWLPRLVFIHGGGQSRRSWHKALQVMAARGFSVISYDLRGHGDSDWSRTGDYDLDAHVRDLTMIINAMPHRPAVIGASLGGRVALQTAAALGPAHVRALVLVDITPRIGKAGLERVQTFLRLSKQGFDSIQEAAATLERFAEHKIGANYFRLAHSIRTGADGRIYWRWDPLAAGEERLAEDGMEARLTDAARRLSCPTLLVRGTESDIVTDDCVAHFRDVQPAAEVIDIKGAGHLMKSDRLTTFCEATLEFLSRPAVQPNVQTG